jgi:ABC-type multidrug transport system fused ATPase/permease subunit
MRADSILVLDTGRMDGWGKHEELLAQGGVYRDLYDQQQAGANGSIFEDEEEEIAGVL